jgi:hypothetical protein
LVAGASELFGLLVGLNWSLGVARLSNWLERRGLVALGLGVFGCSVAHCLAFGIGAKFFFGSMRPETPRDFFFGNRSMLTSRDFFFCDFGRVGFLFGFLRGCWVAFFFASLLRVLVGWFLVVNTPGFVFMQCPGICLYVFLWVALLRFFISEVCSSGLNDPEKCPDLFSVVGRC